jgi:hypothetical protein
MDRTGSHLRSGPVDPLDPGWILDRFGPVRCIVILGNVWLLSSIQPLKEHYLHAQKSLQG